MDDRVLVYRGADQPDMSVINPESDVWQHICVSRVSAFRLSKPELILVRFLLRTWHIIGRLVVRRSRQMVV
jgi:hypothetical protein